MRLVPALDIHLALDNRGVRLQPDQGDGELTPLFDHVSAILDEFHPTGIIESDTAWRVFFASAAARSRARHAITVGLGGYGIVVRAVDLPDEDWARRTQADLRAIRVGDLIVAPPWDVPASDVVSGFSRTGGAAEGASGFNRTMGNVGHGSSPVSTAQPPAPNACPPPSALGPPPATPVVIVIEPSMAFGTGHHATTRLCLRALQRLDLRDRLVIDVGTGSGVLAIAAAHLGARRVVAIDRDPDAIECARANLALNASAAPRVALSVSDINGLGSAQSDVLVGNLAGPALQQHARALLNLAHPDGHLVVSGLTADEEDAVVQAFAGVSAVARAQEGQWVALTLRRTATHEGPNRGR